VELTRDFYLGVHPVTQAQFEHLMGNNPSHFTGEKGGGPDYPVEQVTWDEAVEFCRRLSALEVEKAAGRVYRLPTDAEWEYACRAGTQTPFWWGTSATTTQANFDGNCPYGGAEKGPCLQRTSKVGSYPANQWGLCDMHGNVWQWCDDWYNDWESGNRRVLRSGSWNSDGKYCRAAYRGGSEPSYRNAGYGFRVAATAFRTP
jgi:formylglycine-generating enzyme required for sulfatase activity